MKRIPQSLTAAALAGALALGGTAIAQAQIPAPAVIELDGVEYFKQADGNYASNPEVGNPVTLTAEQAQAAFEAQNPDAAATDVPTANEAPADEAAASETPADETPVSEAPVEEGIPAPATKADAEGNTWYQHIQDKTLYVNDPALVNAEITQEMRDAYAKAFPADEPKPAFDAKQLAWLALPAALVIGGVTWYLSQDGKTYVQDQGRVNQEPTEAEKQASAELLAANKDAVLAQGGKLAGEAAPAAQDANVANRGMAAETGSNTVARGLAALAFAAMIAAGAFAARRKIFA